jgi:hypothetical protein
MTIERLKAVLNSYGGRFEAWPEAERDAATTLIETNVEAKHLLEAAGALDQQLDLLPQPQPADDAFLKRLSGIPKISGPQRQGAANGIRAASGRSGQGPVLGWIRTTGFGVQMTGLAAAGILGLMLGFSGFSAGPESVEKIDASAYLFGNPSILADMENVD